MLLALALCAQLAPPVELQLGLDTATIPPLGPRIVGTVGGAGLGGALLVRPHHSVWLALRGTAAPGLFAARIDPPSVLLAPSSQMLTVGIYMLRMQVGACWSLDFAQLDVGAGIWTAQTIDLRRGDIWAQTAVLGVSPFAALAWHLSEQWWLEAHLDVPIGVAPGFLVGHVLGLGIAFRFGP